MTFNIYSWNYASNSARVLAEALGGRRIKHEGSRFRGAPNKIVVNWGSSELPNEVLRCRVLNTTDAIRQVSNKLSFFQHMNGDRKPNWLPDWTADRNVAVGWLRDGKHVVCRTVLQGHSGAGIVIATTEDEIVNAPLYVQYKKKKDEYRIHCMQQNGRVSIFYSQRKARRQDAENPNWQVRNHQNGFIYQHENVQIPEVVESAALTCFDKTNLHFGAVDVIYNENDNRAYVLEINTAPGLSGLSIERYRDMIRSVV